MILLLLLVYGYIKDQALETKQNYLQSAKVTLCGTIAGLRVLVLGARAVIRITARRSQ